jgi:putative acetyltransferase
VIRIVEDDLRGPQIAALLRYHLEQMHRNSPPGSVFAFDIDRLRAPDVTFWSAWDGDALAGCGALKDLGDGTGEIKSMRTAPTHLRRGVAAALLDHVIAVATARGYWRISLETGSGPAFDPALELYLRRGFANGEAFADYVRSDFNQFLHIGLAG